MAYFEISVAVAALLAYAGATFISTVTAEEFRRRGKKKFAWWWTSLSHPGLCAVLYVLNLILETLILRSLASQNPAFVAEWKDLGLGGGLLTLIPILLYLRIGLPALVVWATYAAVRRPLSSIRLTMPLFYFVVAVAVLSYFPLLYAIFG